MVFVLQTALHYGTTLISVDRVLLEWQWNHERSAEKYQWMVEQDLDLECRNLFRCYHIQLTYAVTGHL